MNLLHDFSLRRISPRVALKRNLSGVLAMMLVAVLAVPGMALAQQTTSTIRGKILDAGGSPVSNALVEVRDERTGITRSFTSNDSGTFLATRLPPGGPYKVTVNSVRHVTVESISVADIFNLRIDMEAQQAVEEIVVVGQSMDIVDVAAGPAATFGTFEMETSVAFNRDIVDVYGLDPRLNVDNEDDGFEINCAGKHPRFNSITLDGVSQDDRFGLNSNGYSTAVGMPFPFDAIAQVAVELAPFDVTYGGFSACNINAVTKSGSNEWTGNVFFEHTSDSLRGDELGGDSRDFSTPSFNEEKYGFTVGGPLIQDRLFMFAAYESSDRPRFLARGFDGSGIGVERPWFSQADHDRIVSIANNVYGYDPGGQPGDGSQEAEKYMLRFDWNINDSHNLAFIYNYFDGFQDRDSDGDSNEFEFANHFYQKGAESETFTVKLASNWTDAFSTEVFLSTTEMNDSQVTVGPKDFGDFQITIEDEGGRNTVYLGADDSRQANALNTEADFFKLSGQFLAGDHVITGGFESEELTIFNQFVQHSNGGEYDFFDDSRGNPDFCAALTAQGRFDNPDCGISGIDRFELGRPSRVYYGSGGGTNDPADAAANFSNTLNAVYIQDEWFLDQHDLVLVGGLRYEFFDSSDRPNFNQTFFDANGIRNDHNIDGVDLLMPRLGFTWGARDDLSVRGGFGLYSGGNPNVWISNAWSNDGLTNVQEVLSNFSGSGSVLDGTIPLSGAGQPGFDVPQELVDRVANTTADSASNRRLVLIDPDYEQPNEWKFALGATYDLPWGDIQMDVDYLHTELNDSAYYVDLAQEITGSTLAGSPIYENTNGSENYMLTNSNVDASSDVFSVVFRKDWDFGLDLVFGYAYTEAEDVSPMTSSVAASNFDNLALTDINNPVAATSNYEVPHRFSIRASYGKNLFGNLETRVTAFAFAQEGQPQSYVMDSNGSEDGQFFGRHLLYVPNGASDPNVVFDDDFPQAEFFDWVAANGLAPGFTTRNGQHARWSNRVDFRIDQELPSFGGTRAKLFFKIYNLGNFLSSDWGKVYDAQFFSVQVVDSDVNDAGQFVFEDFNDRSLTDLLENRSLWSARLGIEINF
jgi:outer membrane receptor for ferrienterochelin and colicin